MVAAAWSCSFAWITGHRLSDRLVRSFVSIYRPGTGVG
jgi:hypothetical protein